MKAAARLLDFKILDFKFSSIFLLKSEGLRMSSLNWA